MLWSLQCANSVNDRKLQPQNACRIGYKTITIEINFLSARRTDVIRLTTPKTAATAKTMTSQSSQQRRSILTRISSFRSKRPWNFYNFRLSLEVLRWCCVIMSLRCVTEYQSVNWFWNGPSSFLKFSSGNQWKMRKQKAELYSCNNCFALSFKKLAYIKDLYWHLAFQVWFPQKGRQEYYIWVMHLAKYLQYKTLGTNFDHHFDMKWNHIWNFRALKSII